MEVLYIFEVISTKILTEGYHRSLAEGLPVFEPSEGARVPLFSKSIVRQPLIFSSTSGSCSLFLKFAVCLTRFLDIFFVYSCFAGFFTFAT